MGDKILTENDWDWRNTNNMPGTQVNEDKYTESRFLPLVQYSLQVNKIHSIFRYLVYRDICHKSHAAIPSISLAVLVNWGQFLHQCDDVLCSIRY